MEVLDQDFTWGYEGSEDWIRDRFHNYLKEKLVEFVDAKNKYLRFIADCHSYSEKRKKSGGSKAVVGNKESYDMIEDEDEQTESKKSRESAPVVDEIILRMPLAGLIGKPHFMYFLQFHNPSLSLLAGHCTADEVITVDNF